MGSLLHDPLRDGRSTPQSVCPFVPQVVGAFGMNFATWMSEQSAEVSKVRHMFPPLQASIEYWESLLCALTTAEVATDMDTVMDKDRVAAGTHSLCL